MDCEIDAAEFSRLMESWRERDFRINVMDIHGEPLIHVDKSRLTDFDAETLGAEFVCDETKFSLNLVSADRWTSGPAQDFEAWLRAYSGEKLLASFLLYQAHH